MSDNKAPELKPCPFAHTPDQLRLHGGLPQVRNEADSWWVSCPTCGASTVSFIRPKSAELAWNSRSGVNARAAAVEIAVRIGKAETGDPLLSALSSLLRIWHAETELRFTELLEPIISKHCGAASVPSDAEATKLLRAAVRALQSYKYGNASDDLANEIIAAAEPLLKSAQPSPTKEGE